MKNQLHHVSVGTLKMKPKYVEAVTRATIQEDNDLYNSIKLKGIETPLIVNEKYIILDGHRRFTKAVNLGIKFMYVIIKKFKTLDEEYRFVCETNLNRRNMNEAQKIFNSQELFKIETKLAKQRQKKGTLASSDAKGKTSHKVAKIIGVSPTIYEKGQTVIKSKDEVQISKWLDGIVSTTSAYNNVQAIKYQANTLLKLPKKLKPLLVQDPAWKYGFFEKSYNTGKTAAQHYKTMTLEELKKLQLGKLCPPDAVTMMWCTGPTFNWALDLMASQGFQFKTVAFVWVKTNPLHKGKMVDITKDIWMSLGNTTRPNCEYVLLGERGKGLVRRNKSIRQVVFAPVGKHSEKPIEVMNRIKTLYGKVPSYEAFARKPTPGFTPLGNEIEKICDLCDNPHDPKKISCIKYYKKLMDKTPGIERCHRQRCHDTKNVHNTDYTNKINGGSHCVSVNTCGCEKFIPKGYCYKVENQK